MDSFTKIQKSYNSGIWEENFANIFDELKREQNENLYHLILKSISENKNQSYVEESLRSLKFYTNHLSKDNEKKSMILMIQKIALDKNTFQSTRERAITELGNLGNSPDTALREILESEEDRYLRLYAFRAILTQLKLPHEVIDLEMNLAINGEIEPSFARIDEVTQTRADGHFDHLNS